MPGSTTGRQSPDPRRKRKFELPGIHELSKEQERARALPKEGQHLIVGGPGTGKSVLALIRARRHDRDGDNYLFLVFNHLLNRATRQLFDGELASRTWIAWFLETFEAITGQRAPRQPPTNGYSDIDWQGVDAIVEALPDGRLRPRRTFLVIDEGQDMAPQFYRVLSSLGFENFFVVADQNQQIRDQHSSRQEIEDCLAIDTSDVIELARNYRNGYRVAKLARAFYTGDPASPPPALPPSVPGTVPLLYSYDRNRLDRAARGILRAADRDPSKLIGIIAPNNRVRERYLRKLRSVEVQLDNPRPAIQTFHMGEQSAVAFDQGGILAINAQACKGLEFDAVILADIDEHYYRPRDPDAARRLFYVMVARARERVFMLTTRGGSTPILQILPADPDILRREEW